MSSMSLGREDETTEFVDGMDGLDDALRSMVAILNRKNRALVLIGIGDDGEPTGARIDDDAPEMIRARIREIVNAQPTTDISIESIGDRRYVRISAIGYETPYSWKGWFWIRAKRFTVDGSETVVHWTETPTCSMKRHRIASSPPPAAPARPWI